MITTKRRLGPEDDYNKRVLRPKEDYDKKRVDTKRGLR